MTKERELLRRAVACLLYSGGESVMALSEEIDSFLSTPSDDAEEPVGYQWLHSGHFRKQIPKNANAIEWYPLYIHPPRPAEPEAETIETLKAENFKLASGQCTEEGPWGDEGGTPYCKYAARKPMTAKEMLKGIDADTYPYEEVLAFVTGIRYAEKHHGIGGGDE